MQITQGSEFSGLSLEYLDSALGVTNKPPEGNRTFSCLPISLALTSLQLTGTSLAQKMWESVFFPQDQPLWSCLFPECRKSQKRYVQTSAWSWFSGLFTGVSGRIDVTSKAGSKGYSLQIALGTLVLSVRRKSPFLWLGLEYSFLFQIPVLKYAHLM